jgi:hypothetical protein
MRKEIGGRIWNFPEGLELKVKVRKIFPCGQQLSFIEDMI